MRLAVMAGSVRHYFHKDHLGSSTAMTDQSGVKVESAEYMPFGHLREHTGAAISNYKFTDQELDPESGLYNYDARLYDPVIGRFISPDSMVPYPFDPQSLNRYSYCRNNPLIYVDPTGHYMDDGAFDGVDESDFDGFDASDPTGAGSNKGNSVIESNIQNQLVNQQEEKSPWDDFWNGVKDFFSKLTTPSTETGLSKNNSQYDMITSLGIFNGTKTDPLADAKLNNQSLGFPGEDIITDVVKTTAMKTSERAIEKGAQNALGKTIGTVVGKAIGVVADLATANTAHAPTNSEDY